MHKQWANAFNEEPTDKQSRIADMIEEIDLACDVILGTIADIELGHKRAIVWLMGNEHSTTIGRKLLSEKMDLFFLFLLLADLGVKPSDIPREVIRKYYRIFSVEELEPSGDRPPRIDRMVATFVDTFLVHLLRGAEAPILDGYQLQHSSKQKTIEYLLKRVRGKQRSIQHYLERKREGLWKTTLVFYENGHYEVTLEQAALRCLLDIAAFVRRLEKCGHHSDALNEAIQQCRQLFEDSPEFQRLFPTTQPERRNNND